MVKPWLLMDKQERLQRAEDYASLVSASIRGQPIDEGLLISVKPPDSRLGAMLELWLYQQRKRGKYGSE